MAEIYKSATGRQAVEATYRRALERWPAPNRQLFAPTSQGDTFVVVCGPADRPPVVLLHGSGANSSTWIRDIAEWSQEFRVYAVDVIGEPGFSAPSRPSFESDAYVKWLDNVWSGLGLQAAAIVGISLGGWLGIEYAVKRPHRVSSLSLVSPSGVGSQNLALIAKVGLLRMFGEWGLRRSLRLVAGGASLPPEATDFVLLVFRHFRPRMEKLPFRTDEELAALSMPVQVILGGRDPMLRSSETRARMARHVRRLHLTFLEDEGHILPRQTRAIGDFLRSTSMAAA